MCDIHVPELRIGYPQYTLDSEDDELTIKLQYGKLVFPIEDCHYSMAYTFASMYISTDYDSVIITDISIHLENELQVIETGILSFTVDGAEAKQLADYCQTYGTHITVSLGLELHNQ